MRHLEESATLARKHGHAAIADLIGDKVYDIEQFRDIEALLHAVEQNDIQTVSNMVAMGVSCGSALEEAAQSGSEATITAILSSLVNDSPIFSTNYEAAVETAVRRGRLRVVELLLEHLNGNVSSRGRARLVCRALQCSLDQRQQKIAENLVYNHMADAQDA